MANALAKNMRYSLKSTTQLVPLKQEIENMNDYLFIQKILWDNRLTVTINTQKACNYQITNAHSGFFLQMGICYIVSDAFFNLF